MKLKEAEMKLRDTVRLHACLSSVGASPFRSEKDGRASSGCSFLVFVSDEHDAYLHTAFAA
jgi:hypothetical protein